MTVKLEVSGAHASPGILEFIKEVFYLFTILFILEEFFDFLLTRFLSRDRVAEFSNKMISEFNYGGKMLQLQQALILVDANLYNRE
jgi:uncharacterized membrane protein